MKKYAAPQLAINKFAYENIIATSSLNGISLTKAALNEQGISLTQESNLNAFQKK